MQHDVKHIFRIGIVILLFLIILAYAYLQARKILEGPEIHISSPKNGSTVYTSLLSINGQTKNINFISLDDRPIFIDEQGNFNEKLLLYPGYNIMKFEAKDKFGKDKLVLLQVNYQAPPPSIIPVTSSSTSPVATSTATTTTSTSSKL